MWRKPVWAEGQFVSQHQFQAQDRYHEGRLNDRLAAIRRHGWGIVRLEVDERLLKAGQFGLVRLQAVWADGLTVDCGGPSGEPLPAPRAFEAHLGDGKPLDVFLGVANEGGSNVPPVGQPADMQRFSRTAASIEDFNTGGSPQDVEFAVPNLRLVFGGERRERTATLPIAQLVRQSDGKVALRDTFIPPVLHITAAPFLTSGLRRVIGAMMARQRELAASRKQRTTSAKVEFHYTDARRFWLLHTLNTSLARLTYLLDCEEAHPEEVYLALAEVVGALSTFSSDVDPLALPKFNYVDMGDVFEVLFAQVLSLVGVDSTPAYTEIPLERRPDGMFVGKFPEPRLANHEFFISVQSSAPEAIVRERVPQVLKVAGWKHITEVVKQARHGVRAEVEWTPSSALPVKPGLCFFRLRREGPFWEEIAKSSTLALYMPNDNDWKEAWLHVYALDPAYLR
jgi:type VI secretion system protein ImpJ